MGITGDVTPQGLHVFDFKELIRPVFMRVNAESMLDDFYSNHRYGVRSEIYKLTRKNPNDTGLINWGNKLILLDFHHNRAQARAARQGESEGENGAHADEEKAIENMQVHD